jgi:beta-lactamase class A
MFTSACGFCFFLGRTTGPDEVIPPACPPVENVEEMRVNGTYKYINPLLECDNYQPSQLNSVVGMETQINDYIAKAKAENKATFVSVYYRDLNFGPWMGINEKENFSPASLLKVPIMIAALKKAEADPTFLNRKLQYTQQLDLNVVPNIKDPHLIKIGNSYTVENLIERMIEYSDNEAKELILRNLEGSFIIKVMTDIGVNVSGDMNKDFISVKDYSGFFRLLYNATYLSRSLSEKALGILSKTSFDKGLLAGLPKGLTVSHKFGERAYSDSNVKQLHECGIVYHDKTPYLICVMTRGTDFAQLEPVIADISGIVYKSVAGAQ